MEASLLVNRRHILAESPLWHSRRNSLFWVDIENEALHEYSFGTKTIATINLASRPGFIVQGDQDNLIVGLEKGIVSYNLENAQFSWLKDVEENIPEHRCNDGKCDNKGRLWLGTMHLESKPGDGSLYLLDSALSLHKKIDGLTIPNGLAWSLDHQQFYHIDSIRKTVIRYRYDGTTGNIAGAETVISIPSDLGLPDGMTIDEEGMLWIAQYGGHGVYRWNPDNGSLIDKIDLPVPNVTSCTFGGQNMDTLFITTASEKMDEEAIEKYPLSGSIFTVKPGTKGVKANIFIR